MAKGADDKLTAEQQREANTVVEGLLAKDDDGTVKLPSEQDKDLSRCWRTWVTVLEMLADRGYIISEEERGVTRQAFQNKYGDDNGVADRRKMRIDAQPSLEMMTLHTPLPSKKTPEPKSEVGMIHVEFSPETTIGIKHLRQFAHTLDAERYTAGIFITIGTVTTAALRAFEPLREQGIIAEHFQEQDLLVNITKHELVPKHYLMSPEEKAALLKRYRLKQSQLPKIQSRDPVAKYLGLKSGQVVKIIRKSETAGRYASYRLVL